VRLQAERRPHSADRSVGEASFRSHRADRPVRCIRRRRTQRSLDHGGNLIVVYGSRPTRAGFVKQAITAILQKSAAQFANGVYHEGQVRRRPTCLANHPHTAGSRGTAQIATGQHDDDVLASLGTPDSALSARSAALSHLHSPQVLSSKRFELSYNVTNLRSR
jgi:hypothetical protein